MLICSPPAFHPFLKHQSTNPPITLPPSPGTPCHPPPEGAAQDLSCGVYCQYQSVQSKANLNVGGDPSPPPAPGWQHCIWILLGVIDSQIELPHVPRHATLLHPPNTLCCWLVIYLHLFGATWEPLWLGSLQPEPAFPYPEQTSNKSHEMALYGTVYNLIT